MVCEIFAYRSRTSMPSIRRSIRHPITVALIIFVYRGRVCGHCERHILKLNQQHSHMLSTHLAKQCRFQRSYLAPYLSPGNLGGMQGQVLIAVIGCQTETAVRQLHNLPLISQEIREVLIAITGQNNPTSACQCSHKSSMLHRDGK